MGEGTGIHLDEAWVGGKEQVSRFHNLLNTRCGSLAVVGAKEKAIAFRKHALAGSQLRMRNLQLIHHGAELLRKTVEISVQVKEKERLFRLSDTFSDGRGCWI